MDEVGNCEIYGSVDFGEGPVRVRCTQRGSHIQHRCEVFINAEDTTIIPPVAHRQNVFGSQIRHYDEQYETD